MATDIIEYKGGKYLRIKDKAVPVDHFDKQGKPVISIVRSETRKNANGGTDCTVRVPCLQIVGGVNTGRKE